MVVAVGRGAPIVLRPRPGEHQRVVQPARDNHILRHFRRRRRLVGHRHAAQVAGVVTGQVLDGVRGGLGVAHRHRIAPGDRGGQRERDRIAVDRHAGRRRGGLAPNRHGKGARGGPGVGVQRLVVLQPEGAPVDFGTPGAQFRHQGVRYHGGRRAGARLGVSFIVGELGPHLEARADILRGDYVGRAAGAIDIRLAQAAGYAHPLIDENGVLNPVLIGNGPGRGRERLTELCHAGDGRFAGRGVDWCLRP